MRLHVAIIFALLVSASISSAQTVTASVDSRTVSVQQPFTLTIEAQGSEGMPVVKMPDFPDLAIVSGPMQSSSYSWVNGRSTVTKSVSYTLVALSEGSLVIPALDVRLERVIHRTDPIKLTVLGRGASAQSRSSAAQAQNSSIFLEAQPSKTEVVVGEPLAVVYKLYTQVSVYNYQIDHFPDAIGFWSEEIPQAQQPRLVSEIRDGIRYNTAVLKTVIYYPTKSGRLTIEPMEAQVEIEVKSNARRRGVFNDPFLNDPFFNGIGRRAPKNLYSHDLEIEVKDLPEPAPAGFKGAVGRFNVTARLDTAVLAVGDAVGLHLRLEGRGNFKTLQVPDLKLPASIDAFKPEKEESVKLVKDQYQGYKDMTYLLVPREAGTFKLDPISFTYFDPVNRRYRTSSSPALQLEVLESTGAAPVVVSGYTRQEVELMGQDIRFIKSPSTRFTPIQQGSALGFWLLIILGAGLLSATLAYEAWQGRLAGDRALLRRNRAWKRAQALLKQARTQIDDSVAVSALLERSLKAYLGDRLNVAENALETRELLEALEQRLGAGALTLEVRNFLENIDRLRFAPETTSGGVSDQIETVRNLLKQLNLELSRR